MISTIKQNRSLISIHTSHNTFLHIILWSLAKTACIVACSAARVYLECDPTVTGDPVFRVYGNDGQPAYEYVRMNLCHLSVSVLQQFSLHTHCNRNLY